MTLDFTPEEEKGLLFEYQSNEQRIETFRRTASPGLSNMVGQLYRNNSDANPGVVVSAAQAVVGGQMSFEQANQMLLDSQKLELQDAAKEKPKGFSGWLNSGLSAVRTASRWTMATLNFVPQTVTNVGAQIFSPSADRGTEGWFISTDLGTLIKNDEVAGDGFFIGGKAMQMQAERARRYRGEIDGKAWTLGRGAANLIVQPNSKPYNILSGIIDAGAALVTPSLPGLGAAKGVAATQFAKAGEVGGLGMFTRSAAGLLDAERVAIDPEKVRGWITSRGGRQVVDKISSFGLSKTGLYDDATRFDQIRRTFSKVQDPEFWVKLTDAKSPDEVRNLLLENLGKGIDEFDLSNRSFVEAMSQKFSRVERLAASVPGQHLVLQSGNSRDVAASITNLDNYLKLYAKGMDRSKRQGLVLDYARSVSNDNNVYNALQPINKATEEVMQSLGVPKQAIDQIMSSMKARTDISVHGALDAQTGKEWDSLSNYVATDGTTVSNALSTAFFEPEMMKTLTVTLPDPRKIRRITSDFDWLFRTGERVDPTKFGDTRLPQTIIESVQNELWRPITLMTPGYVFRNMADSAFRMSFAQGIKGGVLHPLQWIMIATHRKVRGSVIGKNWDSIENAQDLVKSGAAKNIDEARRMVAEQIMRDGADEFMRATNQSMRELYSLESLHRQGFRDRVWNPTTRGDKVRYSKGVRDQISLLHDDEITRRLAQGYDDIDQAVQDAVDYLSSSMGAKYIDDLQARWSNREVLDRVSGNRKVGTVEFRRADGSINELNVETYVKDALKRLQNETGMNDILIDAVARGSIVGADGTRRSIFLRNKTGQRYGYDNEWVDQVNALVDDANVQLPEWVKYSDEAKNIDDAVGAKQTKILSKRANESVNKFFSEIYPKRSAYLMQSPVFRQYYYRKVSTLIDELNSQGVIDLRNALQEAAVREGAIQPGQQIGLKWLSGYVGGTPLDSKLAKKIVNKINNPSGATGTVTLDQMDKFAKGFALDATKELFYSAAERSNFADILRIVAPFGTAWAEVISSWTKILSSNPDVLRKVGVSVQGVRDADPDNDGKGFFYKDPQTGEYVFNYPYSDKLGSLTSFFAGMGGLTGLAFGGAKGGLIGAVGAGATGFGLQQIAGVPGTELVAPAKTLTMGLNILPGLGPFAQIAANRVLGQIPEADTMRKWMTPYGEPELTLVPSWAQKVIDAVSNPENNRLLGDMKIETMRALAATGNYDLTSEAEKERLENDATSRARVLLFLRGLGQFTGPTRPTPEFTVETFAGDKLSSELSKAFRDFQTANYDTAVENFISTFGEDVFLYMASKTKSQAGGLDASTEFGNFERENRSLFNRYSEIAGYFAPAGTNFDYQVYTRFLDSGRLQKVRPSELIDDAQALVGKAIYRNVARKIGGTPNAEQKEFLRGVRAKLYERYPGYETEPVTIGQLEDKIVLIRRALLEDTILDNNPIAIPAKKYLEARDKALAEANARGYQTLGGKNVADLRAWLRNIGDGLVVGYPDFEKIYSRVFFNEIDVDAGE